MEEYLTTKELSERIKMTQGSIRNLIWKKELVEGVHFVKPTRGRLLFVWSQCQEWLHGTSPLPKTYKASRINI